MLRKIWMNKVKYYPYLTLYIYLLLGGLAAAVKIQNKPGIVVLGSVVIPLFMLTIVANIKTYVALKNSDSPVPKATHAFQYSPECHANKTLLKITWMILIVTIVISTYMHHFQPQILNVPSNTDVTSWKRPSFETPFYTCIAWFYLVYSIVLVVGKVYPGMNIWKRAGFSSLLAVMSDVWLDPIVTAPEFLRWIWAKGDFFLLLGIPLYNFLGWLLLIAVFAAIWEYLPQWEETWGRTKATVKFLYACIIADMAIFPLIIVFWFVSAPQITAMIGHGHAIAFLPRW